MKRETMTRTCHHAALASLHPSPEADGLALWRKLRRIEARAHRAAEAACSHQAGADAWEVESAHAAEAVRKVFGGTLPRGFFVNGDGKIRQAGRSEVTLDPFADEAPMICSGPCGLRSRRS